jgi:hypothetical protein
LGGGLKEIAIADHSVKSSSRLDPGNRSGGTWHGKNCWHEGGDRLFTNCIVAVHTATRHLAWYVPTWKYMPSGYVGPEISTSC